MNTSPMHGSEHKKGPSGADEGLMRAIGHEMLALLGHPFAQPETTGPAAPNGEITAPDDRGIDLPPEAQQPSVMARLRKTLID
jgi:hypothetical protein